MNNERHLQIYRKIAERVKRTLSYCADIDCESFMHNLILQEACVFNVLQVGELAA